MKIASFDDLVSDRIAGGGVVYYSTGSNGTDGADVSGGGDVIGEPGDYSVVGLRSSVSLASNLSAGVSVGDVLTIMQASPALARFATPSNVGGATLSYGSNATRVSEIPLSGSSNAVARADHQHDGIGTITASSSNTMQRGTFNLRPGSNVSFGLTDGDGDGEFDTLTVNATGGSSSGGGLTHSYVGYDTIGGSSEALVSRRQYMKKVTISAPCVITSIGAYIKQTTAGNVLSMSVALLTDSSGSPGILIGKDTSDTNDALFLSTANGSAGSARWVHCPMGVYVTAGDYWIAVQFSSNASPLGHDIYYDGSGGDRYFTNNSDNRMSDSGWTTVTTSSNKYSIRASTIS